MTPPKPPPPTTCAWCQPTPEGELVSHGICPDCAARCFSEVGGIKPEDLPSTEEAENEETKPCRNIN